MTELERQLYKEHEEATSATQAEDLGTNNSFNQHKEQRGKPPLSGRGLAAVEALVKVLGENRRADLLDRSERGVDERDLITWADPPFPVRIWKILHMWKHKFPKIRQSIQYVDKDRAACLNVEDLADITTSNYVGDFASHYGGRGSKIGEPTRYHFKITTNVFYVQVELIGAHCSGQGVQSLEQMIDDWFKEARDMELKTPASELKEDTLDQRLGDIPL